MNNQQKQQVLEQIKSANNVLVTVSANPTVDELSASVGLTLALNKMGKHATTVFSGVVPSTIEFLQPEQTIETTTDSLRDFIIALDKSKADKLRYKVENDVVRIFITPYKTKLTEDDLQFSHGDFNVDAVVAIGVTRREDLDNAVTAHGRILHDATVMSITRQENSELGSINWQDPQASSLCEMVANVTMEAQPGVLDGQMATAFLTGIIAETDRFRNEKTTPLSLSLSSQLMSSGANQQLIAEKLEEPVPPPIPVHQTGDTMQEQEQEIADDGTLSINHHDDESQQDEQDVDKIHIDEHGNLGPHDEPQDNQNDSPSSSLSFNDYLPAEDEPNPADEFDQNSASYDEAPTLPQPDSDTPMMHHEKKVITPPSEEGKEKSDKPFDLNAAMQAANNDEALAPVEVAPQEEEKKTDDDDNLTLPKPPEITEHPKITQDHNGPMLTREPRTHVEETEPVVHESEKQSSDIPAQQSADVAEHQENQPTYQAPEPISIPQPLVNEKPQIQTAASPKVSVDEQTLTQLEEAVDSPHVPTPKDIDAARNAVANAADAQPSSFPKPAESTGAQNVDLQKVAEEVAQSTPVETKPDESYIKPEVHDSTAPPPVPPPMTAPQFYDSNGNNEKPIP